MLKRECFGEHINTTVRFPACIMEHQISLDYPFNILLHRGLALRQPHQTVRWHTKCRPLWLQVSVMVCPLFHPSVRTGRLGKFIYRATAPDPHRGTALPLLHQHHRSALLGQEDRTKFVATARRRRREDGWPTGAEKEEEEWTLFFLTFVSLVRLILLVAQAEGVRGVGTATEPALGRFTYRGGTADRKQVFFFFFCLIILAFSLARLWRR